MDMSPMFLDLQISLFIRKQGTASPRKLHNHLYLHLRYYRIPRFVPLTVKPVVYFWWSFGTPLPALQKMPNSSRNYL